MMHMRHASDCFPARRLRGYATLVVRAAIGLLLVSAVASAIVATGLDLLPRHP